MIVWTRTSGRLATVLGSVLLTGAVTAALAGAATAATAAPHDGGGGASHVLFVQTDNTAGNQIAVYRRAESGTLNLAGTYNTGGLGGQLTGSVVDHLASQGSLAYDRQDGVLLAVNAGSNTVTVFASDGTRLYRRQVLSSGGTFPVSIAVHADLVYVLNARNGGSVQGYRLVYGHLAPIPGSNRPLGLNASATPEFVNTPGQVAFSPTGRQLIVTTKANGDDIDVFGVSYQGTLSATPDVNAEPGTVPFAITFDSSGYLVIANAGTNSLTTFRLRADGTVTAVDTAGTGQAATCWVAPDHGRFYASNAGSATVTGYSDRHGSLTVLGQTATDPGTVDATAGPGGMFLYVRAGLNGTVDTYRVAGSGSLTEVGTVTVAGAAGGEGIAAA